MIFPNLAIIPESADKFSSQEFSPSTSQSMSVSIQVDSTLMADKATPYITVMGSNISGNVIDMVPVKDESGNSGPLAVNTPFVRNNFPYKYIGIQYTANGNVGGGTLSVHMEQKLQGVAIA